MRRKAVGRTVFSTATSEVLTLAAGRERPDATTSPNMWRHGGDSFPSVHVSAAFAIGTVFAESGNDEYRWIRRIIGYGIATGTAYVRVHENVHWLSDTVAGSALGIATARFVLNRQGGEQTCGASISALARMGGNWPTPCVLRKPGTLRVSDDSSQNASAGDIDLEPSQPLAQRAPKRMRSKFITRRLRPPACSI